MLYSEVTQMLQDYIEKDVIGLCYKLYQNLWFLVVKKNTKKYQLINVTMRINKITIQNANLSPLVDKFSQNFTSCKIISLTDFFPEYDQVSLHVKSRDLADFITLLSLFHMIILLQDITNLVAQFVHIVIKILADHILNKCRQFLDNISVLELKSNYKKELNLSEIHCFVFKHILSLNSILLHLKRADCTMLDAKSQFSMTDIKIIDSICDAEDRYSHITKIIKILE